MLLGKGGVLSPVHRAQTTTALPTAALPVPRCTSLGTQHAHGIHRTNLSHASMPTSALSSRRAPLPQPRFQLRAQLKSEAELFSESVEQAAIEEQQEARPDTGLPDFTDRLNVLRSQAAKLTEQINGLYNSCFANLAVDIPATQQQQEGGDGQQGSIEATVTRTFSSMDEATFTELGRTEPKVYSALIAKKEQVDGAGWRAFQGQVTPLKLQRSRMENEIREISDAISDSARTSAQNFEKDVRSARESASLAQSQGGAPPGAGSQTRPLRVVMMTGFESFNVDLYKRAAMYVKSKAPHITLEVFSDRDLDLLEPGPSTARVAAALDSADVFFGSLLFNFDQVEWLRERIQRIPIRFVFESALELTSCTKVGEFTMGGGQQKGPPPAVKKVLSLFGSGREEDRMVGYLSFLKIGPKLLKFIPGQKAADLRNWLTVYSYWNQGGLDNVVSMLLYIASAYPVPEAPAAPSVPKIEPPKETPSLGSLHPEYGGGREYFSRPQDYMKWYEKHGPLRGTNAPRVGVLLYRKHVITEQPYITQLISCMEQEGCVPVPIFINGVEAHTVVRDLLTTDNEQKMLARGEIGTISPTLSRDAVRVDAVVSTIGFPLVGGPAGSMEGGRQAEVAKAILSTKNVPYQVAAPLLIQDMDSWTQNGVAGLQSVVLYSLPELDGAIDTVPLGGLVGDNIFLVPERVRKLCGRLRKWVDLRRKPAHERKVAVLLYGFPPGVGATGTAALLNVPNSLVAVLRGLKNEGYDLGDLDVDNLDGESLIAALTAQEDQRAIARGASGMASQGAGPAENYGVKPNAAEVSTKQLKEWLTYPPEWGPTEWGPIPFLPDNDVLIKRMQNQWGDLSSYRGIMTSASGQLVVPGLRAGNVYIGVQPLLGLEGDPMRLLFERDLTPHPQYAAFYKWLQEENKTDVVLHFGMHGTVEWLPGSPLGNNGLSWSDVLMGDLPNVYVYAANNPSESIIAKRRGYGTIISHNVPPYGRAGLYKQLASLRDLIQEWREAAPMRAGQSSSATASNGHGAPASSSSNGEMAMAAAAASAMGAGSSASGAAASAAAPAANMDGSGGGDVRAALVAPIIENMRLSGLQEDVPFMPKPGSPLWERANSNGSSSNGTSASSKGVTLLPEDAGLVDLEEFDAYVSEVYSYLQLLENRLFSEGLHVLGTPPSRSQMSQYLNAYFDGSLPQDALEAVADNEGIETARARLEKAYRMQSAMPGESTNGSTRSAPASVEELEAKLDEAVRIRGLLSQNTQELTAVLKALRGEYILPEAGGDLLRDGAGVLPTGRNIHALDPYRMPSPAAYARGTEAARAILDSHRAANQGTFPETVSVNLWGLDAIKTKGESVAMVLELVGARPVKEGTGRIARFELIPLEELGRPRVDVLCNMSGIFRDSFQNVVELLDELFHQAAAANEPPELNYVRKHSQDMQAKGLDNTAARLFSNPAGDYGSMVNERVGAGNWEKGEELGDTWVSRNAFSYGRGKERGAARPEVLQSLLSTTDRVVQEVDSVEYGLTDIQEYYANTGALQQAAASARGGKAPGVSIVEAFGKEVKPRELKDVLRIEYRTKLLNPRWAEAMAAQGSGGAYEISQRMTAMVGWGATSGFREDWTWNQAAETYAFDEAMAEKLRRSNPQAFSNVVRRMLEAAGRGMWNASPETLDRLRALYSDLDDQLEGVK